MRIFVLILTLVLSGAFCFFNLIGFRGVLTVTEFFIVNTMVDILLAFILGHFMFRTYANYRKAKKLQQEFTQAENDLLACRQALAKEAPAAQEAATQEPSQAPTVADAFGTAQTSTANEVPSTTEATDSETTDALNSTDSLNDTALYKTPLTK